MDSKFQLQNAEYLKTDQYRDSSNLGDRAQLHQRYASNPQGWFAWVMDHVSLRPGIRVLECGCGPGWLWRDNLERIEDGCQITLTDLSPGMVSESEGALAKTGYDFRFLDADIMNLPFDSNEFDIVIANHMLYHVPDRQKALAEVKSVLKENGRFIAATIGSKHMLELRDLRRQLVPDHATTQQRASNEFSLENGRSQLAPWFRKIDIYRYENRLMVTEVNHLFEYVLSSSQARSEVDPQRLKLEARIIQQKIDKQGSFVVTTDSGLFEAKNGDEA